MALLIDSSVVIELERRRLTLDWLATSLEADEPLGISAVTLSEMLVGVHLADTKQRREAREAFIEDVLEIAEVLDFDASAAAVHARLWARLRGAGAMIGLHDLIIAATALAHDYDVMTDNVEEFQRIPSLQLRQPDW